MVYLSVKKVTSYLKDIWILNLLRRISRNMLKLEIVKSDPVDPLKSVARQFVCKFCGAQCQRDTRKEERWTKNKQTRILLYIDATWIFIISTSTTFFSTCWGASRFSMCSCKQLYLPPTINNSSRAAFAYISRSSDWQQQQRGIYLMRFVKNTSAPRYLFTFPLLWSLEDSARPMVTERQTVCAELWYKSIPFDYCCSLSGYCKQGVLLLLIYSQARQPTLLLIYPMPVEHSQTEQISADGLPCRSCLTVQNKAGVWDRDGCCWCAVDRDRRRQQFVM